MLHDRVDVYIGTTLTDAEKLDAKRHVVINVTFCSMGRSFKTYPRHRWVGVDISVGQASVCAALCWLIVA